MVAGQQGGFDEIAINGGAAEGQPHPALLDVEVRRAIAHGIDRLPSSKTSGSAWQVRWRR